MPIQTDRNDEEKNQDIERVKYYQCWQGQLSWQDICEKNGDRLKVVGRFLVCYRRTLPKSLGCTDMNALESLKFRHNNCEGCLFEITGKWENSIRLKTKQDENGKSKPIANLSKSDILTAIRKYIDGGCSGEVIAKKENQVNEGQDLDEVPF